MMVDVSLGTHVYTKSMQWNRSDCSDWVMLSWPCILLYARSFLRVKPTSVAWSSRRAILDEIPMLRVEAMVT